MNRRKAIRFWRTEMAFKLDADDLWLAAMVVAEYSDIVRHAPHDGDLAARQNTVLRLDRLAEKLMEIRFQPATTTTVLKVA